jgi:hypothetical protein
MERILKTVGFVAAVLSIAAIIVSAMTYLKVDRLQRLFEEIRPLELEISLIEPESGAEIRGYVTEVEGQITLARRDSDQDIDVNLTLAQRDIDVVVLVRPLSEANLWWAQTKPAIDRKGYFQGSANIGDKEGRGVGIDFQIIVIAVPRGAIAQGDTFRDLPTYGAASRMVTVRRIE